MKSFSLPLIMAIAVLCLGLVSCAGAQPRYHEVAQGESWSAIAQAYGVTEQDLKEANADDLEFGLMDGLKVFIPFEKRQDWNQDLPNIYDRDLARQAENLTLGYHWPVQGRLTSTFGFRRGGEHEGIDVAAPRGTRVSASRDGWVVYADSRVAGYGKMVVIQHSDLHATVYAHLSRISVKKGQFLKRGQRLGNVGRTGHASGPHLHFEIRDASVALNPLKYLPGQFAAAR